MAERTSINVYVDPELRARLKASGINFSYVAREAWRAALEEIESSSQELEAALGPIVHTAPRGTRRGPRPDSKRWRAP